MYPIFNFPPQLLAHVYLKLAKALFLKGLVCLSATIQVWRMNRMHDAATEEEA